MEIIVSMLSNVTAPLLFETLILGNTYISPLYTQK